MKKIIFFKDSAQQLKTKISITPFLRAITLAFPLLVGGGWGEVLAQSPQAIKYQGVARDNVGNELSYQTISLKISILSGSSTGNVEYTETHAVTTNEFGLFSLEIGGGTLDSGNFSTINWGSNTHFLKVEMDENGGANYQFMGTSQLLSVPYALYADSAGAAPGSSAIWSKNLDTVYYNAGYVGIGTASPKERFNVSGGKSLFENDLGVSPSQNSAQLVLVSPTSNGNKIRLGFGEGPSTLSMLESGRAGNANFGYLAFQTRNANILYERMRIDSAGNVGIGTTTPGGDLHVYNSGYANLILEAGSDNAYFQAKASSAASGIILSDGSNDNWTLTRFSRSFRIIDGINTRMLIDSMGNIGIGTTNPSVDLQLHRMGTSRQYITTNTDLGSGNTTELWFGSDFDGTTNFAGLGQFNDGSLRLTGSSTLNPPHMVITDSGNVGIGTTSPVGRLDVRQTSPGDAISWGGFATAIGKLGWSSANTYVKASSPGNSLGLRAGDSNTNHVTIATSGNVGNGTTTPDTTLHVVGLVKITGGTPVAGEVLTTDGTGLATWEPAVGGADGDWAVDADTLYNLPDSSVTIKGGRVGIGDKNPGARLEVVNDAGDPFAVSNFASNNGDMFIVRNNGNVGIGTSLPSYPLHVSSSTIGYTAYINNANSGTGYGLGIQMNNTGNTSNALLITTGGTDRLVVRNSGEVGIGTGNPDTTLHIVGSLKMVDGNEATGRVLTSDINGLASWQPAVVGADGDWTIDGDTLYSAADSTVTIKGGNVGIGTTSPSAKLEVDGLSSFKDNISMLAGKYIRSTSHNYDRLNFFATGDVRLESYTNLKFYTGAGASHFERVRIDDNGNVGIGTTAPAGKFHVNNDVVGSDSSFVVTTAGNVGIGTASPSEKLHVAGAIKADSVPLFFVKGTTDVSVGTTETDMPETSITVTTDGSPVKLQFWCGYYSAFSVMQTSFYLYRDVTMIRSWNDYIINNGESKGTSITWIDQPVAGTYVYKIGWRTNANTSERNAATDQYNGSILIAEVMKR